MIVRGGAVLLHVAARIAEQWRKGGIFARGPVAGSAHQHDPQRCLKGAILGYLGTIRHRHRGLEDLDVNHAEGRSNAAGSSDGQAKKRGNEPMSGAISGNILCHGVG